jgi:P4 family phage/plasmid primase-like protien
MDAPAFPAKDISIVTALALLAAPEYERVRKSKAEELGWRTSVLDSEVEKARRLMRLDDDAKAPAFTDEALALTFSERYCDDLRYVAAWGHWYEWTGTVWKRDATLRTFNRARAICREASLECNDENTAASIASGSTTAAVERLARYDRRHAATVEQWDADHWLLNTPGGVVDLRTGKMRHHRAEDHMTKITAVAPGGDCPQWLAFLKTITNGDIDRQTFLQRVAGYCLTGSIREHALFFGYGTGGNGKGVFLNTLTGLMADYAAVASMETFTASTSERHPTDLAMLRGARLVTAQETEQGRKWAEAKIKAMTGGDPVTARFMRQDFFTYMPNFKLFIAGNHKPGLRSVDEAIRRRMNLIPFDVKIPPVERDAELPEKLMAEWPGILKWMIAGCLEWQRIGLAAPQAVTAATNEYFSAEDAIGLWLAECCELGANLTESSSALFSSWSQWTNKANEFTGSQKNFSQTLASRGHEQKRTAAGVLIKGIELKPPPYEPGMYDM